MRILAISGSLRAQSTNTSLLEALRLRAPDGVEVLLYDRLEQIPPFNPDLEMTQELPAVLHFRAALQWAEAVVFSTPEYAHGIPGSLKNALDWVVGTGELSRKPVTLVNASGRGVYAQAALREVLKTMDAVFVEAAEATIDLQGRKLTAEQITADPGLAAGIDGFFRQIEELAITDEL